MSLEDHASGNYRVPVEQDRSEIEDEIKKCWTAINRLKENKVDKDTFDTKIFEIERELDLEEEISP